MIDGHVHIERGDYSIQWINKFVKYALDRGISEIYLLEHSHRFLCSNMDKGLNSYYGTGFNDYLYAKNSTNIAEEIGNYNGVAYMIVQIYEVIYKDVSLDYEIEEFDIHGNCKIYVLRL